jgi:hypothetical protein
MVQKGIAKEPHFDSIRWGLTLYGTKANGAMAFTCRNLEALSLIRESFLVLKGRIHDNLFYFEIMINT